MTQPLLPLISELVAFAAEAGTPEPATDISDPSLLIAIAGR